MITPHQPIQVMIVDDSTVVRGLLARTIEAQPDLRVVASVPNGRVAVEMLRLRAVDVVLLDIEMPEMDGLTALPLMLKARPGLPVIMASSLTQQGAHITMRALALGAADYIPKPSALSAISGMAAMADELIAKIRVLGRGASAALPPLPGPFPSAPELRAARPPEPLASDPGPRAEVPQVLAIASSTGGPNALAAMLSGFGRGFHLPVLIAQHMPPVFTGALADRLQRETGRPCREAVHGETILPGHTYIAPGDHHLTVMTSDHQSIIRLDQSPPVNFCRPSADPMFASLARVFGPAVVAVVLTGMGEDGLAGCRDITRAGGRVLVQDEESSVVWGMPGAVFRAGLASAALAPRCLADRVQHLVAASGSRS